MESNLLLLPVTLCFALRICHMQLIPFFFCESAKMCGFFPFLLFGKYTRLNFSCELVILYFVCASCENYAVNAWYFCM